MRRFIIVFVLFLSAVVSSAEVLWMHNLSYRRFTTQDGLPQMQAETVWQDSRGYIYIGTLSGFVRYDGRTLTPFLKGRRENIVAFAEGDEGVNAIGFRRQWTIHGDKVSMRRLDPSWQWVLNNFNAADLPNGMVLMENDDEENRRLCTLNSHHPSPTTQRIFQPFLRSYVLDLMTPDRKLYVDSTTIYVPTMKGMWEMVRGERSEVRGERSEVRGERYWLRKVTPKADIFSLLRVDKQLYALAADGIYTLTGHRLTKVTDFAFEAPDYGLAARATSEGKVYIADAHNIYVFDGRQVSTVATGFNMIKGLFVDRWDRLWVPTYQGVYLFFHTEFVNHRLKDENDIVRALCVDDHDRVIAGTLNGRLLVDGEDVEYGGRLKDDGGRLTEENFYLPSAVNIDGKVYMAGNGDVVEVNSGVQGYEGTRARWIGLPYDRYQFVAKAGKTLIVGSRRQLLAYDPLTAQHSLLTADILHPWCAADDERGNLWVGSSCGLYQITFSGKDEGRRLTFDGGRLTEEGEIVNCQLFDWPQKLMISAMTRDEQGHVFFSSNDSLFVIRNEQVENINHQLPLLQGHEIRSLYASSRGYLVVATIDGIIVARIGKGDEMITDARWFDHTNGFTMLEPLKATMTETADGTIWLAGLEEATSFRLDQLLTYDPDDTIIEGPTPWWNHWWVLCLGCLVLGVVCWLLARIIERRRSRKAMLRLQREKKLKELQISAIRLKAIPHFHSNVLAGIEYFLMKDSVAEATRYLKLYSDFTNQTLTDIDRPARTVTEEIDYTNLYLQLEQLRFGERLQYDIHVGNGVNRQTMLPTMLLYTYCQNAVKHGIGNRPTGGRIDVSIDETEEGTVVKVSDNGVGRAEAARRNQHTTKQGLRILMEQIELYNQTNRQPVVQTVTDLFDEQGEPAGTCYEMMIPKEYVFES